MESNKILYGDISTSQPKKVALYCRVSTDRQENGLQAQQRALEEYCKAKGINNYILFLDEGISGAKASRPELDRMMQSVRTAGISSVIVYSFSRFARSTKHLLSALEEFNERGVAFISLTENVDTTSAIGKALFTIISAISQLERELIAERVRNGLSNAKAKGKRIGRPKTRNSELIRALASEGRTYREIARLAKCSTGTIATEVQEMTRSKNIDQGLSEQNSSFIKHLFSEQAVRGE